MRAFVLDRYKKKGTQRLGDVPEPPMGDDDALIEVHAAGLNLLDSTIRDGEFKLILPYRPPFILGHDVAGTGVRVGSKVRQFNTGDEIYARPRDGRIGTFAEFISVDAGDVALKPKDLSMEEAASIPLVGLTAWQALVEKANLQKGQKILIHAGSGGVGTFAILGSIRKPILVANGDHDIMVPSSNSVDLARRLPNSELVLYEDAGHGGIFQYHEAFVSKALEFLAR